MAVQKKVGTYPMPETGRRNNIPISFMARYRGFGKDAHRLLYIALFGSISSSIMWFILVLYLKELGYSPSFYGAVFFLQGISQALIAIPAGRLSDFYGRKKPIVIGSFLSFAGSLLLIIPTSPALIFTAAILMGTGMAIFSPAFSSILAERTDTSRRKYLYSLQSISMMVGSALAMLVAGYLPDLFRNMGDAVLGYRIVIAGSSFFMLARALLSLRINETKRRNIPEKSMPESFRLIMKFSIPNILIGLGAGIVVPFMPLQFQMRFGISSTAIGSIFALNQILMIFVILALPHFAEKRGSVVVVTTLQGTATILMLLVPATSYLAYGLIIFTVIYLARAILMNSTGAILTSFRMNIIPEEDRAVADATAMVSWLGFNSIGAFIGGYLIQMSVDVPFYIGGTLYALSVISYYLFFRKMDDRKHSES